MRIYIAIIAGIALLSCNKNERSDIALKKLDRGYYENMRKTFPNLYEVEKKEDGSVKYEYFRMADTVKYKLIYNSDNAVASVEKYNASGFKVYIEYYNAAGIRTGLYHFKLPEQAPPSEAAMLVLQRTELFEGPYYKYYPDGRIMEKGNYKDGKPFGVSKKYDKEGYLYEEIEFKDEK